MNTRMGGRYPFYSPHQNAICKYGGNLALDQAKWPYMVKTKKKKEKEKKKKRGLMYPAEDPCTSHSETSLFSDRRE